MRGGLHRSLHKAREFDDSAGSLEHGFPIRFGRRGQSHGRRGTGCVCHLAGKRALPDQRVQFELVAGTLLAISAGSRNFAPAGLMHSWASCAPAVFVAYCFGVSDR